MISCPAAAASMNGVYERAGSLQRKNALLQKTHSASTFLCSSNSTERGTLECESTLVPCNAKQARFVSIKAERPPHHVIT